jgi:hypothetical protein
LAEKNNEDYFELQHPENPKVITRAIHSIKDGMGNFVIM